MFEKLGYLKIQSGRGETKPVPQDKIELVTTAIVVTAQGNSLALLTLMK